MHTRWILTLTACGLLQCGHGQLSLSQQPLPYTWEAAQTLYQQGQWLSAMEQYNQLQQRADLSPEQRESCAYYALTAAMQLGLGHAETALEQFVGQYPASTRITQLYPLAGHYYFQQDKFRQALDYFEKTDEQWVAPADKERFYFEKGYALFSQDDRKGAKVYLTQLLGSARYQTAAQYYLGYMAYENNQFADAQKWFGNLGQQPEYQEKTAYPEADMAFRSGQFELAITKATVAMNKATALEKSALNKMLGESHFHLGHYAEALPFLQAYRGNRGQWSPTDYYQLGYVFYRLERYDEAVQQLNKIVSGKDAVAQNAYYHLGICYLKKNQKPEAFQAFKSASDMTFDAGIREQAWLNYAKLSYELGNAYQNVTDVLSGFLQAYPDTAEKGLLSQMLVQSYVSARNYQEALALLTKTQRPEDREILQKVAFYRGLELMSAGKATEALPVLNQSLEAPVDPAFTARALFWKAEAQADNQAYAEAIDTYKKLEVHPGLARIPEKAHWAYHLAYAYFKRKAYEQAAPYFEKLVAQPATDKGRWHDAWVRLGDCRFILTRYWPALEAYTKALELKGPDADYAQFQKAVCYGFIKRNDKKISELQAFLKNYKDSKLADDALFELANTYVSDNNTAAAHQAYAQLWSQNPKGLYAAKALLRQGLLFFNAEKDAEALTKLKAVAEQYPATPEALEAVATVRLIDMDNNKMNEYAAWVRSLGYVEVSDAQLDQDSFEGAEKAYMQGQTERATAGLEQYLASYPQGQFGLKAHFYMGQLYTQQGLNNNAAKHYEAVVALPKNDYSEPALIALCKAYDESQNERLTPTLLLLEQQSDHPQHILWAQTRLMQTYQAQNALTEAATYANKLLASNKIDAQIKAEAQVILARQALAQGDAAKAKTYYTALLKAPQGELAAEALCYDALDLHQQGQYEASNKQVQQLAKQYAAYKAIGARGLLVMARNYHALHDDFQAMYIVESVEKNFSAYPEVIREAQSLRSLWSAPVPQTPKP